MKVENEIWADIPGFEGLYQASTLGRIKSLGRHVNTSSGRRVYVKEKVLSLSQQKSGHLLVWLRKDGSTHAKCVHRLIAETYIGPCPPNKECCHNNAIPSDNRVENLRWDTRANNIKQSYSNGRKVIIPGYKGLAHGSSILTEAEVKEIRASKLSCAVTAVKFGVSPMTISRCRRKITYSEVD